MMMGNCGQVGAFGDPGRDPRGWCVSVAYAALLPSTMTATAAVGPVRGIIFIFTLCTMLMMYTLPPG